MVKKLKHFAFQFLYQAFKVFPHNQFIFYFVILTKHVPDPPQLLILKNKVNFLKQKESTSRQASPENV